MSPCVPWEFVITEPLTAMIRQDKETRQAFYQNPNTHHNFYTGIEPMNPAVRPGKTNPPLKIHAFAADYDIPIPDERVDEAVKSMKVKPAWIERSLGGNVRLVWTLAFPLLIDDYAFCAFVLGEAVEFLKLGLLPALDEKAFVTPSRLLCNGGQWRATGHPAISEPVLQSFFVSCGRKFRFQPVNETVIPLDLIEAQIKVVFPGFDWPGAFEVESQGPTFWIPESTSPLSAIVKPQGIFTFSANATKPFYSWSEILGAEFVKDFTQTSVSKATKDICWDGKRFWKKGKGIYVSSGDKELTTYLKVDCRLSAKPDKTGVSAIEVALNHIYNENRVKCAAPFVFRPAGVIQFQGDRILNTYINRVVTPAAEKQIWGPQGNFPFISKLLDGIFDPADQLTFFLAWFKYYYMSGLDQVPLPGQNAFFMGGVSIGKTYLNREIIGAAVGGYTDASDFLVDGTAFNSHLMHVPHWCLDDDTPSNSPAANAKLHALFKKIAANQSFLNNEKFQVAGMTEWMGRIGCTTNLDYVSSRIVGPMDNNSLDKTCLFRCVKESSFVFPARRDMLRLAASELPFFLRWLVDYVVPDFVPVHSRYGFAAFHQKDLLDQSHQSNPMAPFKEMLIETLGGWFQQNLEKTEWTGTVSQLIKLISMSYGNDILMRSVRLEQVNRYLEQIQKEALLTCSADVGPYKTRIWKFYNPDVAPASPLNSTAPAETTPTLVSIFTPKAILP